MTALFDTNVIIDILMKRIPFYTNAARLLELGRDGRFVPALTANSVSDIFYIVSKRIGKAAANLTINYLLNTLEIVSITHADCAAALALPNADFEDALVEICAKKIGADYVVSRDEEFITVASEANVIKPDELLAIMTR